MDTRFLETFLMVVDNGSIAAAARRLGVTPAAVSQRIRSLEDELGFPLFLRNGRTVSITEAGAAIVSRSRDFMLQIRDLKSSAGKNALFGELRLGAISTALTGYLPGVLSRLTAIHPGLDVRIEPGSSVMLYQQVLSGELDAAIVVEPHFNLPKTCDWKLLYEEPLVLLKPSNLPGDDIRTLLSEQPFIRYSRSTWGGFLVDHYLREMDLRPRERFELDSLDAVAVLVHRGLGIALVPDWAPPWPAGLLLTKLPVGNDSFNRKIGLVWSRSSSRLRFVKEMLQQSS
jgi:DNA-binding transcriptional LysR family regulator